MFFFLRESLSSYFTPPMERGVWRSKASLCRLFFFFYLHEKWINFFGSFRRRFGYGVQLFLYIGHPGLEKCYSYHEV